MSETDTTRTTTKIQDEGLVTVSDLYKRYGEGEESVLALDDIDLNIDQGEFVSLVGPSGCGKSTLLHVVAGVIEPTEGEVLYNGVDIRNKKDDRYEIPGLVFQSPVLLEWRTVMENVMLPIRILTENGTLEGKAGDYEDQAQHLIELVDLAGFEDSYPGELSGGMQQRVAICQALVYDPELLLMDEPFGALDAFTRDKLNLELLEIWHETEKTILFVTHNLEEAVFLSDRVVVLSPRPGQVVDVVDIDIERPRSEDTQQSDEFFDHVRKLDDYFTDIEI
jgi:NitT/TauT family transport system ATP-binding protein